MSNAEWSYSGENGPEHWHTLCNRFAIDADFKWQSPIALSKAEVEKEPLENALTFYYQEEMYIEQTFNYTFHFIPPEKKSYVVFDGEKYHLTDIHFHLPSEHVLEGKTKPIEFHFVHMNKRGHNLVVGVLFEVDKEGNIDLSSLNWQKENHLITMNALLFLPFKSNYFHYTGSLTTPPTRGPIHWFVFNEVNILSNDFVTSIKKDIVPHNNRPLQPLKGRKVWYH